jgi:hypothetical protein
LGSHRRDSNGTLIPTLSKRWQPLKSTRRRITARGTACECA